MRFVLFAAMFLLSKLAFAYEESGLQISAAVDIVGSANVTNREATKDRLDVREAEIMLDAPIDHLFDGTLSFAAHREKGVSIAEVHEAYISSSKLIPSSQIKAGQYFLGIGRLNRMHRHEWAFITAPQVQAKFFGSEGVLDSGVEYTVLAPTSFYLQATVGITSGYTYGHAHNEGKRPKVPTHYARLASYTSLFAGGGAEAGVNFLQRTDADSRVMRLYGLDFVAKWREGAVLDVLVQSELWLRTLESQEMRRSEKTLGFYIFPQKALTEQFYLGALWDFYAVVNSDTNPGLQNNDQKIVPTLSFKASEFSTLRLGYNFDFPVRKDCNTKVQQAVEVQATFILGAHPAHAF